MSQDDEDTTRGIVDAMDAAQPSPARAAIEQAKREVARLQAAGKLSGRSLALVQTKLDEAMLWLRDGEDEERLRGMSAEIGAGK